MNLKAEIEAIIYATETPVTVEQIAALVKNSITAEAAPEADSAFFGRFGDTRRYRLQAACDCARNQ